MRNRLAIFRGPWIPAMLGLILAVAGAASFREIAVATGGDDWWLFTRTELELLGGAWLVAGIAPRRTRLAAIALLAMITVLDIARTLADCELRPAFGRISAGPGRVLVVRLR